MKKIFVCLLSFLFLACFTQTRQNDDADKAAAKKVGDAFLLAFQKSDYDAVLSLLDDKFYEINARENVPPMLDAMKEKLGNVKSFKLAFSNTKVTNGSTESGDYFLDYDCVFEKNSAKWYITLTRSDDGAIRIAGYSLKLAHELP